MAVLAFDYATTLGAALNSTFKTLIVVVHYLDYKSDFNGIFKINKLTVEHLLIDLRMPRKAYGLWNL